MGKAAIRYELNPLILTLPLRLGGLPAVGRLCATSFFLKVRRGGA